MQGKLKFALAVAVVIACGFAVKYFTPGTQAQENAQSPNQHKDFVREVLPYPLEFTRERILTQFSSDDRSYYEDYNRYIYDLPPEKVLSYKELSPKAYAEFMALPMVKPDKFYVFFGAYAVKQYRLNEITPVSVIGVNNPALVQYAQLKQENRANDIYLYSPDTPYWYSEYEIKGKKLPFRSYFIIHLSAVGENATQVEIIQDKPVVRMKGTPSLDENGKMQDFDLRDVAPTTRDRTYLLSCIRQFIERKVPVRKQFSCNSNTTKK